MNLSPGSLLAVFKTIVSEKLNSVEFGEDYVQLKFDGATLTAYTKPSVRGPEFLLDWNSPGYRDALCAQIRREVASVDIRLDEKLEVMFINRVSIDISLRGQDYRGAEAVMFRSATGETFVV